jgi:hypothetical protein
MDSYVVGICVSFFYVLWSIAVGVTEAVALSDSVSSKSECDFYVWYAILVHCIIHFVAFLVTSYKICRGTTRKRDYVYEVIALVASLGLSTWIAVIYYRSTAECQYYFKSDHGLLWDVVTLELVIFFITVSVIGLLFLLGCVYACLYCYTVTKSTTDNQLPLSVR